MRLFEIKTVDVELVKFRSLGIRLFHFHRFSCLNSSPPIDLTPWGRLSWSCSRLAVAINAAPGHSGRHTWKAVEATTTTGASRGRPAVGCARKSASRTVGGSTGSGRGGRQLKSVKVRGTQSRHWMDRGSGPVQDPLDLATGPDRGSRSSGSDRYKDPLECSTGPSDWSGTCRRPMRGLRSAKLIPAISSPTSSPIYT